MATEPMLIAGLLLLPVGYVPVVVLLSLVLSASEGSRSRHDLLVRAVSGWHCIGPVVVLAVADPDGFALHHWPIYVLAVLAQFLLDALIAVIRCSVLGISLAVLPRPMAWAWGVDALLAPIGVAAVLGADGSRGRCVIAMCPVGILALLGRDRAEHFEKAVAISEAFEAALESARLDPVSGIANRRAWNEATARAALRFAANPMGRLVSVMLGRRRRAEAGERHVRSRRRRRSHPGRGRRRCSPPPPPGRWSPASAATSSACSWSTAPDLDCLQWCRGSAPPPPPIPGARGEALPLGRRRRLPAVRRRRSRPGRRRRTGPRRQSRSRAGR